MSKYENEPQYEHKFFVVKNSILQKELDFLKNSKSIAYDNVLTFLHNINKGTSNNEYLVVNQDEPYADKVWELIKEGEDKKQQVKGILK